MRTGKGKTFWKEPKKGRGVGKTKVVFLSNLVGQNKCITPYFNICHILFFNYPFVIYLSYTFFIPLGV